MYGGMELGLGAFFAVALAKPDLTRPALLAQALALGTLAGARLAGILHDRSRGPLMKTLVIAESVTAAIGAVALVNDYRPISMSRAA